MAHRVRLLGTLAVVTGLYVLTGWLGLLLALVNANVTAVWPPAGIAVAALLLLGVRAWPAVAAGALLVCVGVSQMPFVPALFVAAGNTFEAVVAAALTIRYARGARTFERGTDILRFVVFALVSPLGAATIGTLALRASGLAPPEQTHPVWFTWWLGDATSIALVTPPCVLWMLPQPRSRASRGEAAALAASLLLVVWIGFEGDVGAVRDLPVVLLMLPLLMWAAFRFTARMTATLGLLAAAVAVYRTAYELGPISLGEPAHAIVIAQCLVSVLSLLMLSVASETAARTRVEAELRVLNETLERRVRERTFELSTVHDRLVEAQEVAHVGSWEWDILRDRIWWSAEMCRIFGLEGPPAGYHEFLALVHPDDRDHTDAAVRESARTGEPFSFDHRLVDPQGGVRVVHAKGRVERDASGVAVRMLGTGHDITERRLAEDARTQLIQEQMKLREAEAANRAKDAFLATLSHELRTPLNVALGWAQILRDNARREGRDTRAVDAIFRNLLLQSRLVEDILDVSRISRGDLPLEYTTVEVVSVFEAASEMVRKAAEARGVTLHITSQGSCVVTGDARRLQQVAWNLLDNAVKFAAEGGRVQITIQGTPGAVECSVEDDGPGITPEFLPHVFEQFRQADASSTREHGGLGLGLAIAHAIVERHGGTIAAGNRPSGGAILRVRLPVTVPVEVQAGPAAYQGGPAA